MTLKDDDRTIMLEMCMEKARDSLKDAESEHNSPYTRINRAYYSAFYCATTLLLTKNIERNSHKAILSEFGREFVKSGEFPEDLGDYLRELEKNRYAADYSFKIRTTKEKADDMSQHARIFYEATVKELQKILGMRFE